MFSKNIVRVFIGITLITKSRAYYTLMLYRNNEVDFVELPPKLIKARSTILTKHTIILTALLDFLSNYSFKDTQIRFYPNDYDVWFEFSNELVKNGKVSNQTKDKEIWEHIYALINENNIDLTIAESNNVLNEINKII